MAYRRAGRHEGGGRGHGEGEDDGAEHDNERLEGVVAIAL